MLNLNIVLGVLGSVLLLCGDLLYVRGVFQKHLRPHAFSWLVWSVLNGIAFAAQISKGAGPGAWVTAVNTASCLLIFFGALRFGDRRWLRFDWMALSGAGLALLLWLFTKEALLSVLLIVVVDLFGSLPTFRKGYHQPHGELIKSYTFAALANLLAILALESYSPTTWLYPAVIVLLDGSLSIMLVARRKSLQAHSPIPSI
ncbi:MAG: hypothetical protein Q8Q20_01195 [bacterium]|nr:hypothetical protein [bacterium]